MLKISEEDVKEFVSAAAPVIRDFEQYTGRGANSLTISIKTFYSHRTTQRMLSLAESFGYVQRTVGGKYTRWVLAPTFPAPLSFASHPASKPSPRGLRQLELPLAFAA